MKTQSSFTDAVIVDQGKVVMRVSSDTPNGAMVLYRRTLPDEAVNDVHINDLSNSKPGRISRANIYVGNSQLMKELPFGYCEIEQETELVVNQ
jgi:hypothetical protein